MDPLPIDVINIIAKEIKERDTFINLSLCCKRYRQELSVYGVSKMKEFYISGKYNGIGRGRLFNVSILDLIPETLLTVIGGDLYLLRYIARMNGINDAINLFNHYSCSLPDELRGYLNITYGSRYRDGDCIALEIDSYEYFCYFSGGDFFLESRKRNEGTWEGKNEEVALLPCPMYHPFYWSDIIDMNKYMIKVLKPPRVQMIEEIDIYFLSISELDINKRLIYSKIEYEYISIYLVTAGNLILNKEGVYTADIEDVVELHREKLKSLIVGGLRCKTSLSLNYVNNLGLREDKRHLLYVYEISMSEHNLMIYDKICNHPLMSPSPVSLAISSVSMPIHVCDDECNCDDEVVIDEDWVHDENSPQVSRFFDDYIEHDDIPYMGENKSDDEA